MLVSFGLGWNIFSRDILQLQRDSQQEKIIILATNMGNFDANGEISSLREGWTHTHTLWQQDEETIFVH